MVHGASLSPDAVPVNLLRTLTVVARCRAIGLANGAGAREPATKTQESRCHRTRAQVRSCRGRGATVTGRAIDVAGAAVRPSTVVPVSDGTAEPDLAEALELRGELLLACREVLLGVASGRASALGNTAPRSRAACASRRRGLRRSPCAERAEAV
jgi:hypothetical protein